MPQTNLPRPRKRLALSAPVMLPLAAPLLAVDAYASSEAPFVPPRGFSIRPAGTVPASIVRGSRVMNRSAASSSL